MTALFLLTVLVVVGFGALIASRVGSPQRQQAATSAFTHAREQTTSLLDKTLIRAGRPFAGFDVTNPAAESPAYEALRYKLAAAGNPFAGSVNVFISTQIAAITIAAAIFTGLLVTNTGGVTLVITGIFAAALAYYPWQKVSDLGKKRTWLVNQSLPEFAELLLMPLSSGYGILPALDFTAGRTSGPVRDEVRLLLNILSSRSVPEREAFDAAGRRLGTAEAGAFFATLAQAHIDGTPAVSTIRAQAEHLRKVSYEKARERIKTLPNKLVVIMGVHLMPILFVVVLLPLSQGLSFNS